MKALVVDDSKTMRIIVRSVLKPAGFEVIEAEDGNDALAKIKEHTSFDLATLDYNMPGMNGLELLLNIRSNSTLNDMRVIMVTSEAETEKVNGALEKGANGYIIKPFKKEALADIVKQLGFAA